jgi:hypothetical protein
MTMTDDDIDSYADFIVAAAMHEVALSHSVCRETLVRALPTVDVTVRERNRAGVISHVKVFVGSNNFDLCKGAKNEEIGEKIVVKEEREKTNPNPNLNRETEEKEIKREKGGKGEREEIKINIERGINELQSLDNSNEPPNTNPNPSSDPTSNSNPNSDPNSNPNPMGMCCWIRVCAPLSYGLNKEQRSVREKAITLNDLARVRDDIKNPNPNTNSIGATTNTNPNPNPNLENDPETVLPMDQIDLQSAAIRLCYCRKYELDAAYIKSVNSGSERERERDGKRNRGEDEERERGNKRNRKANKTPSTGLSGLYSSVISTLLPKKTSLKDTEERLGLGLGLGLGRGGS